MKYINLSLVNTNAIKAFSQKLKKFMGKGCNKSHLLIYTHRALRAKFSLFVDSE